MPKSNLIGMHFGEWTVIEKGVTKEGSHNPIWVCRCSCGTEKNVIQSTLLNGSSKSCGCKAHIGKKGVNQTHGMSKTRLYKEWLSMRSRCRRPIRKSRTYKNTSVCDAWENDFVSFMNWAYKNGYADNLTIDRIDNSKGYSPDNCRWITIEEQQGNKTNTVFIEYEGKKYCLRSLCAKLNFPYKLAHQRYSLAKKKGITLSNEKLFAPSRVEIYKLKHEQNNKQELHPASSTNRTISRQ